MKNTIIYIRTSTEEQEINVVECNKYDRFKKFQV
jgi:DNA invertase Pin-like site-specific DNA recombinase